MSNDDEREPFNKLAEQSTYQDIQYFDNQLQNDDTDKRIAIARAASHRPQNLQQTQPAHPRPVHLLPETQANDAPSPILSTPSRRQRRKALPVLLILAVLAVLIGAGGVMAEQWLSAGQSPLAFGQADSIALTAPFIKPSLDAKEINAIMHLSGYMKYQQLASLYVDRMSLDVEIGQLIMVEYNDTYYSPDLNEMVNQLHAGGVIMYQFQMPTAASTIQQIQQMQAHATFPLLISTDEEGGPYVDRLSQIYGPRMSATDIGNSGDPNVAAQQGKQTAHDLLALGINTNLAPDVDVNLVNGYDMVTRTFGTTPQQVITYAGPYLESEQQAGVIGTIKHFPGLGDAVTDAHTTLPTVNQTAQQVYNIDLAPFKALIQSKNPLEQPGIVMPTDVLMPAIDPVYPAELSHTFMTDILRKQFGYQGVVLTDALYMQGIAQQWSMPQAAVLALNAGDDMLLGPTGSSQMIDMINGIKLALQNGTLSKARIDQAATRIIALKMEYHLMPAVPPPGM
jgi:beta-N-acetylhexosaminidase